MTNKMTFGREPFVRWAFIGTGPASYRTEEAAPEVFVWRNREDYQRLFLSFTSDCALLTVNFLKGMAQTTRSTASMDNGHNRRGTGRHRGQNWR
jgi:hypothetical protein